MQDKLHAEQNILSTVVLVGGYQESKHMAHISEWEMGKEVIYFYYTLCIIQDPKANINTPTGGHNMARDWFSS